MARLLSRLRGHPAVKAVRRRLVVVLMRLMGRVARLAPRRLALACGECLSGALLPLARRRRRNVMENLAQAFGASVPRPELVRIAERHARVVGRTFFEFLRMPSMTAREVLSLVDVESFEPIERALARGKGIVILAAHFGAFEMVGAYLAARLRGPVYGISLRLYHNPLNEMLLSIRRPNGVETVYQDQGARPLLSILRRNLPLMLLADVKGLRINQLQVEFFGRQVCAPTGPAALARSSGAALVPVFVTWRGRRHQLHVLPEIEAARTRDKRADIARMTQACARALETIVRRHPEQWKGWLHVWPTEASLPGRRN